MIHLHGMSKQIPYNLAEGGMSSGGAEGSSAGPRAARPKPRGYTYTSERKIRLPEKIAVSKELDLTGAYLLFRFSDSAGPAYPSLSLLPSAPSRSDSRNGEDLSILIVEDNPMNRKLLQTILRKRGFEPDIAEDGAEAVEAFAHKAYDLIFMDIAMPNMDGLEAARRIRETAPGDNSPVIVAVTAYARKEDRMKCLASGMQDYVSKPFRIAEIEDVLMKWIGYIKEYKN
ncbi:response regulator [Paenibacillus chitinolyticus]|uniref:response regulator n=1 Tax=Paenibacillus chitinolyticus TaxID=79263 RepID=UPI0036484561